MSYPPVSELALARAWAAGAIPARLTTVDGTVIEIVFRGTWTHGMGPDFAGAMMATPDSRLLTGSIEFHLVTSGWRQHGHHLDPAYNDVILHLVGADDGAETRRQDGALVPVAVVGFDIAQSAELSLDWSQVGGDVCAAHLTGSDRRLLVDAIQQLGDRRLSTRTAQFEAALSIALPAEVLWEKLLDALGYRVNRSGMKQLAELLPLTLLERELSLVPKRWISASAMLLGGAGFLPLTARDAGYGGLSPDLAQAIDEEWSRWRTLIARSLPPTVWEMARVRPANHPVARLLSAAAILSRSTNGLTSLMLDLLRDERPLADVLINASMAEYGARLGRDRAIAIGANVVIPFALALAGQSGDDDLADRASRAWEQLPASAANQTTRRALAQVTGGAPLRGLGERGMQGLLHLQQALCVPRRCFECPVAHLALTHPKPDDVASDQTRSG